MALVILFAPDYQLFSIKLVAGIQTYYFNIGQNYASDKGEFCLVIHLTNTNMISQKRSEVPPNGRLEKNSKPVKVSNNLSPSKRTVTTYLISLFGLGTLVLAGFAVWSVNRSTCDGTFNLKANTTQGLELVYTKNNCYPAQSQQANK